jgi:2-polyprenyl-3-methyl-5-hydroxy-6-metoxy-1,4-benzoquinol methylase
METNTRVKRDLIDYGKNYLGPFEQIQLTFRRKKVLEILNHYKPRKILEVSCAMDSLVNYLDKNFYDRYYIVEPLADFLNIAVKDKNEKIITINKRIEEATELNSLHFDFIVVSGLLHEVESPSQIMQAVNKLCSNNTTVHINVPNANSFHRLLAKEMGLIKSVYERSATQILLQQQHTFDFDSLTALAEAEGFQVSEKGGILVKPFTHSQMQKMIDLQIIDLNVIEGLYNMLQHMPELGSEIFLNLKKVFAS